jgi:hypothetical protein
LQDIFFDDRLATEQAKNNVKTMRAVLAAAVSAGLAFSAHAQLREQPGEMVELKSLSASVQQTINQKAAGGEIVRVEGKTTRLANGTTRSSLKRTGKNGDSRLIQTENS